jgi:hypothetical protein
LLLFLFFLDRDFSLLVCGGGCVSDRRRSSFPVLSLLFAFYVAFVVVFLLVCGGDFVFVFCVFLFVVVFMWRSVPAFSLWWWLFLLLCVVVDRRQICDGVAVVVSDLRQVGW